MTCATMNSLNVVCEMASENKMPQVLFQENTSSDNCQDVDKILSVVVKRRKTIPTRCMELDKKIRALELLRLENANVITDENQEKAKFRKMIQGFRGLKSFQFSLHDLHEAEQKLGKYFKRIKEINSYLEKRKSLENDIISNGL